jgi:multiple sugar transport system substrate-binding protein
MRWHRATACFICLAAVACGRDHGRHLAFSGSAVGAEGTLLRTQLARFAAQHPGLDVEIRVTPDAANQRHQLYVQWLNARIPTPDVLQLDIVWTAEFAAAGWIQPFDRHTIDVADFFPAAVHANTWRGTLYAVPWFVDVGLLYRRTDLFDQPPSSLDALRRDALSAVNDRRVTTGLVWQGARYEGLVTVFLEQLTANGGRIIGDDGTVMVDAPEAIRTLTSMRDSIGAFVPLSALTAQEEQARFAFQDGQAAFMRNWPYAWSLLQDPQRSRVAGHVGVSALPPADGGMAAAALGGAQLAINRYSREQALAGELIAFLTAREQMLERARVASQLPARRSLYESPELEDAMSLPIPAVRQALDAAVARPVTPVYSELSEVLQVHVHRALTRQEDPSRALHDAAQEIRQLFARTGLTSSANQ